MSILTLRPRTPVHAFPAVAAEAPLGGSIAARSVIERASRALCSLAGGCEDHLQDQRPAWEAYIPQVRAVLGAIRQPDLGMTMACEEERGCVGTHEAIFRAMIDAALDDIPNPSLLSGR